MKKPNAFSAWMASVAALFSVCALVFIIAPTTHEIKLAIAGITVIFTSLLAISRWQQYFSAMLDYKFDSIEHSRSD